ncbi:MAG: hypothetical protein ACI9C4_003082 [Paraglaciecola sp.]|jgi:hypothetical protein
MLRAQNTHVAGHYFDLGHGGYFLIKKNTAFNADELMLAMPPRDTAKHLTDKQWISKLLLSDLQNSQSTDLKSLVIRNLSSQIIYQN